MRRAITDAGGAEYGVQSPQKYLALVREAAPDEAVRNLVAELAVEVIMRKTVDEAYAGEQLVAVRRRSSTGACGNSRGPSPREHSR